MTKILDIENRMFSSTFSKTNEKDFFITFIDYIDFVFQNEEIALTFFNTQSKRDEEKKILDLKYKEAIEEIFKLRKRINKEVEILKLQNDVVIINENKEIDDFKEGKSKMISGSVIDTYVRRLVGIVERLHFLGHEKVVSKYCSFFKHENKKFIDKLNHLNKYLEYKDEKEAFDNKDKIEIRGVFERIREKYLLAKNIEKWHKDNVKEMKTNKDAFTNAFMSNGPAFEWKSIIEGRDIGRKKYIFDIAETKTDLERFHNHIISNYQENIAEIKMVENTVSFNSNSSILKCNDTTIKITKGKDIYYIIKYIFERENIYEDCFYDEMRDYSELDKAKTRTDKNIYDTLFQFNNRLIKAGIGDLFSISFRSIKINNKI